MSPDPIPRPSSPLVDPNPLPVDEVVATVTAVDCSTGEITVRPMTKDELADKATREADYAAAQQVKADADAQRAADLATLTKAAESDPTTAALLRVLGLS